MSRRKRCECCEALKDDVIRGLCGECDGQQMTWCYVCKENVYRDQLCRHIFWTENGDVGPGTYMTDWEDAKPWVFAFCEVIPVELVRAMRAAIAADEFYLYFTASMLGGFAHIQAHGVSSEYYHLHSHFDQRAIGDDARDGLHWLFTLYKHDTKKGNAVTVEWLDEWLSGRVRHETLMAYHAAAAV